ncbi:competence protein ComJ [Aestuariivirga sp.]|uniref:competence protein ComJ n=1 Tax=Aestuariivirga sp. TaxID=2650926 RepID=UPI003BAA027B
MVISLRFEVSFGQLAVFAGALSQPFNDWTNQHVEQGFSWREGSVSFRTISEAGELFVVVNVVDQLENVNPSAIRIIEVPFEVPKDGTIEIGSITETVPVSIPSGPYLLRCEFMKANADDTEWAQLTFAKDHVPHFLIVLADPDITARGELLTTARPAQS